MIRTIQLYKKLLHKIKAYIFKKVAKIWMSYIFSKEYLRFQRKVYSEKMKTSFYVCGINFKMDPYARIIGGEYIKIGDNFSILSGSRIEAISEFQNTHYKPDLVFGNNVCIGTDFHVGCINKVTIGNNVLMASKIFITDHYHGEISSKDVNIPPVERKLSSKGPVIIEDNVWIGEGVVILPGVTIGKNSILGANSVVNKSCPSNSVLAGAPAKIIKTI